MATLPVTYLLVLSAPSARGRSRWPLGCQKQCLRYKKDHAWIRNERLSTLFFQHILAMPVTFTVAKHPAEKVSPYHSPHRLPMKEPRDLLHQTWGDSSHTFRYKELLQSSFSNTEQDFSKIAPKNNGFVDTVITAYESHHNLVIRYDRSLAKVERWTLDSRTYTHTINS